MDFFKQNWATTLIASLATGICGGIFLMIQAEKTAAPDVMQVLAGREQVQYERLQAVLHENEELRDQNAELNARIAASLMQASITNSNTPRATIRNFLTGLTYQPAWCKEHVPEADEPGPTGEGVTKMLFFNPVYGSFYDKTLAAYEGKRDDEMWPTEIAVEFLKNDLEVLREKSQKIMRERVTINDID